MLAPVSRPTKPMPLPNDVCMYHHANTRHRTHCAPQSNWLRAPSVLAGWSVAVSSVLGANRSMALYTAKPCTQPWIVGCSSV